MIKRLAVFSVVTILLGTTPALKADFNISLPSGVQRLDQVWMVTFINDAGIETVAQGQLTSGEYVPLIAADRERLESMLPAAKSIATVKNIQMRLIKFTNRVDLQEIVP